MDLHPDIAELLGPTSPSPAKAVAESLPTVSAVAVGSGAYEGASGFDQLKLWSPAIQSADAEILPEKETLDARTRDMLRNDALVAAASTTHKDGIVGSVFLLNAKPMTKVLFDSEDPKWEEEFQEEVEEKFTLWAESPECWVDAQRTKTLTDLVRLAVGVDMAGGEILATAEWMADDGRPFRTAIQMIDTDRLQTPYIALNQQKIRGGVERDRYGAPIAYHIRNGHPSDWMDPAFYQFRRVMARKPWGRPMVFHQFEQLRPDQSRGISAMVSALQEMKMLKSFRKVELQRAVLAATYAASIESELPNAELLRALGGDDPSGNPALDWMKDYLDAIQEYSGGSKNLLVNGAKIPVFMPGTKLNLKNPGAESPAGDKFEMSVQRYLAAAAGVSYEQFSRDYSTASYSASRMSRGETEKHLTARKKRTADRTASFLYRLWLEEAINDRQIEALKRKNIPNFYEGLNADAYTNAEWIGAGVGMIDQLKETQAYVLQLKHGLTTKEHVSARVNGGDYRSIARQIARERALDEHYGNPSVYEMGAGQDEKALSGTPQERES